MNSVMLKNKRDALRGQIEQLINEYNKLPNGNCYECIHMARGESDVCKKFNAEPPIEFIENPNCEDWMFDELPTVLGNSEWSDFDEKLPF